MSEEDVRNNEEDLTEDQWMLVLWSIITDLPVREWDEFEHDLIYKDRFSSSHKVVEVIENMSEKCKITIKKGQNLYRARIYQQDSLREFLGDCFNLKDVRNNPENNSTFGNYYNMLLAALYMEVNKGSSKGKKILEAYNKWRRKRFKGYDLAGSGAPPVDFVPAGRINPKNIRYLYLAEDQETAIYEVRPIIGQNVSVATFKTMDDIKIYDLAKEIKSQERDDANIDYLLYEEIQRRFSKPNAGQEDKYIPTQYLGELIKQMGVDGLRFKSSLKNGGINIVLFDDKKCKAISSDIVKVSDIKLKYENQDIYQLGKMLETIEKQHSEFNNEERIIGLDRDL